MDFDTDMRIIERRSSMKVLIEKYGFKYTIGYDIDENEYYIMDNKYIFKLHLKEQKNKKYVRTHYYHITENNFKKLYKKFEKYLQEWSKHEVELSKQKFKWS